MLLISIASIAVLSGCGEDRSNLLPGNTAQEIIANLDTVDQLVADGNCFDALSSAEEIRSQVEALSDDVDPVLRRNLLDGVTELQIKVQDECVESDSGGTPAPTVEPEPAPEPEPTQTTGSTGPTSETGTTGGGAAKPEPAPEPTPTPTPTPNPDPGNPGSGGVSPESGGVGP